MREGIEKMRSRVFLLEEVRDYALVNFPQMWSMKTEAMKRSDITSTGTGPLKFVLNQYFGALFHATLVLTL